MSRNPGGRRPFRSDSRGRGSPSRGATGGQQRGSQRPPQDRDRRGDGRRDGRGGGRGDGRGFGRPSGDRGTVDDNYWPQADEVQQPQRSRNDETEPFLLVKEVCGLKIDRSIKYAPKPETPGREGATINLITNYFMLNFKFKEPVVVYQYDVTIEQQDIVERGSEIAAAADVPGSRRRSRKLGKLFNRVIVDRMVSENSGAGGLFAGIIPVYDSDKILFVKTALNRTSEYAFEEDNKLRFRIPVTAAEEEGGRQCNFRVMLQPVARLAINPHWTAYPQEVVQFIDILLRHGPTSNKVPVASNLFYNQIERRERQVGRWALSDPRRGTYNNKELAYGYYLSTRSCEAGIMVNVDRAVCVFNTGGPMIDVFGRCCGRNLRENVTLPLQLIRKLAKELKTLRFLARHLGHKYRIWNISETTAAEIEFELEERDENGTVISSETVTVADYFKQKYGRRLSYPNFPCLVTKSRNGRNYFPLEVCVLLPDQYERKKLTREIQAEVTSMAASQKPPQRFKEIEEAMNNSIIPEGRQYMQNYGLLIKARLIKLNGRVLNPPTLKIGGDTIVRPDRLNCSFKIKHFYRSVNISSWILVDLTGEENRDSIFEDDFKKLFARKLSNIGREFAVHINPPKTAANHRFLNGERLSNCVFQKAKTSYPDLQMILFFIPSNNDIIYPTIKRCGDLLHGVITQCVNSKHYSESERDNTLLNPSYLKNLILKINAKLNGVNHVLNVPSLSEKRIMFVGVDVTHPPPGAGNRFELSIAACVATYDNLFVKYATECNVQPKTRSEMVRLDLIMPSLMQAYRNGTGSYPNSVIVYRDGVSEGQFKEVMAYEVTLLKKFFKTINCTAKLTYVVVQKRHHTRFITANKNDSTKSLNVPPGTTVDTVITDSALHDFFICSHFGMLGTSRPARYWVLYDQNLFSTDSIQQITFYMCFLSARCTKSISIPTPVQYAHLCAQRARDHIAARLVSASSAESVSSESGSVGREDGPPPELIQELNNYLKVHRSVFYLPYFV